MTIRQRLGAVVCFFRGCEVQFTSGDERMWNRHRWHCPRCGWESYTKTAEAAWADMTQDWGKH